MVKIVRDFPLGQSLVRMKKFGVSGSTPSYGFDASEHPVRVNHRLDGAKTT